MASKTPRPAWRFAAASVRLGRRHAALAAAAALLAVALALYAQTLSFGYVWDDLYIFLDHIRSFWNGQHLGHIFQPFLHGTAYFRPLPIGEFFIEAKLSHYNPAASHAVNLAIFCANVLLLFAVARRLFAGRTGPAFCAALIYAVHPALTEPTAWISGRFDLQAAFFALLAAFIYLGHAPLPKKAWWIAVSTCLALLSKETSACLPFALLFLGIANESRKNGPQAPWTALARPLWRQACWLVPAFAASAALYALLRLAMDASFALPQAALQFTSPWGKLHFVLATLREYLLLGFWPFFEVFPYHSLSAAAAAWGSAGDWAGIAATSALLLALALGMAKKSPAAWLFLAGLCYLLPVLHWLVPVAIGEDFAADRFLTMPLAFWALGACALPWAKFFSLPWAQKAAGAMPNFPPRRITAFLAGCWLLGAAWATASLASVWRDQATLWRYAITRQPQEAGIWQQYVRSLLANNDLASLALAIAEGKRPAGLNTRGKILLGIAEKALMEPQALATMQKAIAENPDFRLHERPQAHALPKSLSFRELASDYAHFSECLFLFQHDPKAALAALDTAGWYAKRWGKDSQDIFIPARRIAYLYAMGDLAKAEAAHKAWQAQAWLPYERKAAQDKIEELLQKGCLAGGKFAYCTQLHKPAPAISSTGKIPAEE